MVVQALSYNKKREIQEETRKDAIILKKEIELLKELGLEDYEINYLVNCRIKENADEKWRRV